MYDQKKLDELVKTVSFIVRGSVGECSFSFKENIVDDRGEMKTFKIVFTMHLPFTKKGVVKDIIDDNIETSIVADRDDEEFRFPSIAELQLNYLREEFQKKGFLWERDGNKITIKKVEDE